MATEVASPATGFLRAVSRWEIVALSVNGVVGSGVYLVLPVATAQLLGAASVWAIPAGGLVVLLIVLCFAEAGSRFDQPGGLTDKDVELAKFMDEAAGPAA